MTKAALAANRPLDWLNLRLADVTGGAGPFLAIYLMASRQWDAGRIGLVLTVAGIATVLAPAGAFTDATVRKRTLIATGVLFFLVVADLTRGTGQYNLALGATGACCGLGAALSNGVAGLIVDAAGYSAAFLCLAVCAIIALLTFWLAMPETRNWRGRMPSGGRAIASSVAAD